MRFVSNFDPSGFRRTKTDADELAQRKRDLLAEARADIDAGRLLDEEDVDEWLDALERGEEVSMPEPKSSPAPGF